MTRKTSRPETVTFRASPILQDRIDKLADAHGGNRTKAIQAALLNAGEHAPSDEIPDEAEVLRLLGESARSGNVSAMKELRAYHRERSHPDEGDDFLAQLEDFANSGGA